MDNYSLRKLQSVLAGLELYIQQLNFNIERTPSGNRLNGIIDKLQDVSEFIEDVNKILKGKSGERQMIDKKKNNFGFQYGSDKKMFDDKSLISQAEAQGLWEKHYQGFINELENGNRPEMAIWSGMNHEADYHTKKEYLCSSHCKVIDGVLYTVIN